MRRTIVLLLLLFAGWQFGSAGWIHAKAAVGQWLLERAWEATLAGEGVAEPWPGAISHPVARLHMPRLDVERLVLAGLETPVMAWGPGMAVGSGGHRVVAAHRDTHFAFLERVEVGDRFELIDRDGERSRWLVRSLDVVDSRRTGLDIDWPHEAMTLVTCYPFDAATTGGPMRLVVRLAPAPSEAIREHPA